jgi:hypothetical protein
LSLLTLHEHTLFPAISALVFFFSNADNSHKAREFGIPEILDSIRPKSVAISISKLASGRSFKVKEKSSLFYATLSHPHHFQRGSEVWLPGNEQSPLMTAMTPFSTKPDCWKFGEPQIAESVATNYVNLS